MLDFRFHMCLQSFQVGVLVHFVTEILTFMIIGCRSSS